MPRIDPLLKLLAEKNASDLHMVPGDPPVLRLHGSLRRTSLEKLTSEINKNYFYEIMDPAQIRTFEETNDVDFSYEIKSVARFRGNVFRQNNGVCGVFRIIPTNIVSANELGIPEAIRNFTNLKNGLVLVTGPTGSGKSTTLASLIDLINSTRRDHIITIEDPLEFVHEEKMSVITHRELSKHTLSFANALRAAMREDPDVIMVGEMRDLETISLALTAAEMGVLVFGTLHTNSAPNTINRIIDVFPENQQEQIRTMLASCLKGVVAQQLLEKKGGKGRVAALEVLVVNSGVANLIREGKSYQISSIMETSKKEGNCTMDQALMTLYQDQKITAAQAYRKAMNKKLFEHLIAEEDESDSGKKEDAFLPVLEVEIKEPEKQEKQIGQFVESIINYQQEIDSVKETIIIPTRQEPPEPKMMPIDQFQTEIQDEIERSGRYGHCISLIIIELEGFGDFIETNGGSKDCVYKIIKESLRGVDIYSEANDQVFLVLCPETDENVSVISKRIFDKFKSYFSQIESKIPVNPRIGDATYPKNASDGNDLIEVASQIKFY